MTSSTITINPNLEPRVVEPLQILSPSRLDFTKTISVKASETPATMADQETPDKDTTEPRAVEPVQALSPTRLDFANGLSLEASNSTTSMADQEHSEGQAPSNAVATKMDNETLVDRITEIIASYRISGPGDRYEDEMGPKMVGTVRSFVTNSEPINMLVPAYPFKSPNRDSKVMGPEPDVGERMSLQHFNSIGARIQQIYAPGGYVTIVSDGVCYNDLLGVSDEEVFDYAEGLHRITGGLGLKHLKFTDLFELLGDKSPATAEEYASRVGKLKERVFTEFLPPGFDFDVDIKKDNNALSTYRGYIKFLDSDLSTLFREQKMSKNAAKKHSSKVARGMIERGKAFSALVSQKSPAHVRLSIHASDNTRKLSVALLPHERYSTFPVTPWHNTPYLDVENVSLSLSRKPTDGEVTYKACKDGLGLNFLCADVPMYNIIGKSFNQQVKLEPLYPYGLKVQVTKGTPITRPSLNNVAELVKLHSPVVIEGLDPMQYTSEVADDFRRLANEGMALSIVHEGVANKTSVGKAASHFVQISSPQDAATATEEQATGHVEEQECLAGPLGESLQEVENIRAVQIPRSSTPTAKCGNPLRVVGCYSSKRVAPSNHTAPFVVLIS